MPVQIVVFEDEDGFCPFEYWLNSVGDKLLVQRILIRFDRIKEGNFGDHKALSDGIWELRFTFGGGLRIYYGHLNDKIILIMVGGNKASQSKDLKKAKGIWKQYLEIRNEKN